jgi:hypothetical protein
MRRLGLLFAAVGFPKIANAARPTLPLRHGRIDNVRFVESSPEPRLTIVDEFTLIDPRIEKAIKDHLWADFDPGAHYGQGINLRNNPDANRVRMGEGYLRERMHRTIPPIYRQYVEWYGPLKVDFDTAVTISWRYG